MGENNTQAFSAFVSYSHADKAAAQKLHRKLEGYRLPKHVAAQLSGRYDPAKLGQIFRDREDLPAAEDLSESVKAALAQSQALVVLCSPAAKASPWVAREIETFRKLHPGRPVLAALLSGEPEEAFPQPLMQGKEPLAADLRKEGDGPRLGFLKVVAGIAGVPLDALVQRDAQRRIRRVMMITGGAVAAMLAMAIMTVVAIQARNEAQEQRAEAEGLIEYMLTDLRDELRGVGRLDVMTDVNERAMDYYEGQGDLSGMPAESLERRARILHAMGEDDEKRGDFNSALAKFTEAHRITQDLLRRAPDNPDRILSHAHSEYWIGEALLRQDRFAEVRPRFLAYKEHADKLTAQDPDNLEWLRESGYANGNLCALGLSQKPSAKDALEKCQAALRKTIQILSRKPNDRQAMQDVANRYAWVADAWKARGNLKRAKTARFKQETLIKKLVDRYPEDKGLLELWLKTELMVAEILGLSGQLEEASERLQEARDAHKQLLTHDPANSQWRKWGTLISKTKSLIERRK